MGICEMDAKKESKRLQNRAKMENVRKLQDVQDQTKW